MLPKQNRLPGYKIPQLLNSQKNFHSPLFGLKVISTDQTPPQIGFIVSSKIAKKAVDRNRMKRLLRQAIYSYLPRLKPNHNFLLLAKHPIKNKTLAQIKPSLFNLLKQSKLLTNETIDS